ncbi:MAG: ABC transporter substrate-binding protein [Alphaproteobacteria bacterium]|nr:ABC transporter substrate-binding protein [Alphaproteobacteria bacterium]MBM3641370.1 ABC transporter substrate-binding protein [Alphaproteobacteria bacterium]
MTGEAHVKIGFIPLVDAAALLIATHKGFAKAEGLDVELIREVSWANVRDKLAIGRFDAAHLLAPMAVASTLGLGHVRVPLIAPINLAMNGNAIAVSTALHAELAAESEVAHPAQTARALAKLVARRRAEGREPLTFGMTFPFSMHNYQLRFWMAEGGIDPDEDLRLIVLPPPYMVENLARGQLDGFCVGAPWSSVAVDAGVGVILHFGCEIFARAPEKVLALRESVADDDPNLVAALLRALHKGAAFVDDPQNLDEVSQMLSRPEYVGVDAEIIRRVLTGHLRIKAREERADADYLIISKDGAMRPDPWQAEWIYAQMLRWGQTRYSSEMADRAKGVLRPDLFDAAIDRAHSQREIGAFAGPSLDGRNYADYLEGFAIGQRV